ncbi:MAG: phage distal tail protein [Micromonosporaceae bacterium]
MAGELITGDGQVEFGGLLLGRGTEYKLHEVDGWDDLPGIDQGSADRPNRHGSWPGEPLTAGRVVTAQGSVRSGDAATALDALRSATRVRSDANVTPLVVRTPGGRTHLAWGKIDQRVIPTRPAQAGGYVKWALQWLCDDPRRYSLDQHIVSIPPPATGSGLVWPLTWPLDWGTPVVPGSAAILNAGDAPAHPVLTIPGPLEGPLITNTTTGTLLEFDITLGVGEQLVIDCDAGTVTLGGADRLNTLTDVSVPVEAFVIESGFNAIVFNAFNFSGLSPLVVTYRDAYL